MWETVSNVGGQKKLKHSTDPEILDMLDLKLYHLIIEKYKKLL